MFWWTYIKLLVTPPGFATDVSYEADCDDILHLTTMQHVPKGFPGPPEPQRHNSRRRPPPPSASYQGEVSSEEENVGGPPYSEIPQRQRSRQASQTSQAPSRKDPEKIDHPVSPTSSRTRRPSTTSPTPKRSHSTRSERTAQEPQAGELDVLPPVGQARVRAFSDPKLSPLPPKDPPHTRPRRREIERSSQSQRVNERREEPNHSIAAAEDDLPPIETSRRPPLHPTLLPEYRFCRKDNLVKPMRAHHCSTCATVCDDNSLHFEWCLFMFAVRPHV